MKFPTVLIFFLALMMISPFITAQNKRLSDKHSLSGDSRPYARYWWFASEIQPEDVRYNLDWLKKHGFGGVELAWVYPLNRFYRADTSYTPRQEWLSYEWADIVEYTIRYADSVGLGCDLTFGTLWPFGDTYVPFDQATQKYGEPEWRQQIRLSWQHPKVGYVVDHLTPAHYRPYFDRLLKAFPRPHASVPQAYFIDSWEVETDKLWCDSFERDFNSRFGYDITPHMDSIYDPACRHHLYDYMSLVSDKVLRFYSDFDSTLNSYGILSRGQVSGAPCDLISGYALMDIPEGESMLFEPEYCAIPASAALLSGKKTVSSEAFTCLYGWPRDHMREEQAADLKLVADALFANGINHIIWHGKPHNPMGFDTVNFYATTHIGDSGKLEPEITAFNRYLETVSGFLKRGSTYSDIAVYLPTEDAWTAGIMPVEQQFKWAWGYYEMRYVYFPDELTGYNPAWINKEFLSQATVKNGTLRTGNAEFKAVYINAEYLDYDVLKRLVEFAENGVGVILKRDPKEPGSLTHGDYIEILDRLKGSKKVANTVPDELEPFITGSVIPRHWCRKDGLTLYVFFPNLKADRIKFPLEYGQSLDTETDTLHITICYQQKKIALTLEFKPYQSLLFSIEKGKAKQEDISFVPATPVVKSRPADYKAPWLVYP
jgi:hypothetical protein